MGWRYRKSVSILPGVRVNFGLHSTSLSLGGKGFRTTYSSTGRVTRSVGIPGTGLSYVTTSSRGSRNSGSRRPASPPVYSPLVASGAPAISSAGVDVAAIRDRIYEINRVADQQVDWDAILVDGAEAMEGGEYFAERVNQVLDGDIDTYFEIIADINPFDDLISYGSGFDCGTDDPRMMAVHFKVNSRAVLGGAESLRTEQYNELLEDYVCGCAIRVARDMLALLPVRHVIVDASEGRKTILSVDITRRNVEGVDFAEVDPSDFIRSLNYRMDFDTTRGFKEVETLD